MTSEQQEEIKRFIALGEKITISNPAMHGYFAIKAMYEELIALRAANKGKDQEIEQLEQDKRFALADFNHSQTQCRDLQHKIDEITSELSKAKIENSSLKKELKHHQSYTGCID